ncbi:MULTISPECIES: SRPBCC family protein [Rhodococcus]|uniref:SRPBCC family protein n=1 Tax=Rhodococcus TaxID=1827 RepID=UPI000C99E44D|nr:MULTISPECIES: SRPBCC family protein [Rhodococcus]PND50134.1 cyclase [Rhodococcus sp. ENV425]WKW98649.1 SRPBCC family protein [Rhodococcus aetherivorans]
MTRTLGEATRRLGKTATETVGKAGKTAAGTAGQAGKTATGAAGSAGKAVQDLSPTKHLQKSLQGLAGTFAERALSAVSDKVTGTAGRLNDYAEGGGGNLLGAVTGVQKSGEGESRFSGAMENIKQTAKDKFEDVKESLGGGGKGKGGGGKKIKLTNIVEQVDVGVPIRLAYDQWTLFADWPKFMKKVEQVEQASDEKLQWTGKVFWSRRNWESTILEQVPFDRIVWRSKGAKGYIDGAVTFHEITDNLTRIIMVLEYHPKGLFEKTANLWRAVGRRARLELKHFERHVMTEAVLHAEDIQGWHGEIRDSEVVKDDETARREEEEQEQEDQEQDVGDEGAEDELAEEETEDEEELPEDELSEEEDEEELPEDQDEEDEGLQDEADEEPEEEPAPARRRRAGTSTRKGARRGART